MCVCSGALQLKQSRWRLTVVVALKRKWVLNERDPSGVEGRQKSYSGNSVRPGDSVYWIWRPPWGKQARQASKSKQAAAQLQVDFHPPTSQDLADRYRERRTILKNTYRNSRAVCDTTPYREQVSSEVFSHATCSDFNNLGFNFRPAFQQATIYSNISLSTIYLPI